MKNVDISLLIPAKNEQKVVGIQFISTSLLAESILYSSKKFDYRSSIDK